MNDEQMKKLIEDMQDSSKQEGFMSMLGDFYNRRTMSIAILAWTWGIIFIIGAIYCGVRFFETSNSQSQIMYATLFLCFYMSLGLIKVFAWEVMHRNSIKREIKRLELRIAELSQVVQKQ